MTVTLSIYIDTFLMMRIDLNKIFALLLLCVAVPVTAQRFSVEGGDGRAYTYLEDYRNAEGINAVIVVYGTADKVLRFTAPSNRDITWYTYDDVLNPLPSTQVNNYSTIPLNRTECGYVVMHDDKPYYLYVIDYIKHPLMLSGVSVQEGVAMCDVVTLDIAGSGKEMTYYAFNNMYPYKVERDIIIEYNTLEWNEEALAYSEIPQEVHLKQFSATYPVTAPLCNTVFTVKGDRFLKEWNMLQEVATDEFVTVAVEAQAKAVQSYREAENEIDRHPEDLGGSAPVDIEFNAYYTDAVTHIEWQFSSDANFKNITHRYNDEVLRFTFREDGTVYVRLVASSVDESCIYECEPLVINIGSSSLEIPNAFSPGTIDGKNDEWRVAFKSIVEFRCWIFNKQGVQLYYSENPGEGWDGTYGGRLVAPGAYYYVIEARGADAVDYKRSGHINVLHSRKNRKASSGDEAN